MKKSKLIILSITFLSLISISCSTSDEPTSDLSAWKLKNETYFTNMKDSTEYLQSRIPIARGGSSFYYKIKSQGSTTSGSPLSTDSVTVNYKGKMINGTIFDQTYSTLLPDATSKSIKFKANKLIQGWTENLIQMKAGEIRTIVIPQDLGYGVYGYGPIPPYSTLVFDIQLISFTGMKTQIMNNKKIRIGKNF